MAKGHRRSTEVFQYCNSFTGEHPLHLKPEWRPDFEGLCMPSGGIFVSPEHNGSHWDPTEIYCTMMSSSELGSTEESGVTRFVI